MLKKIGLFLMVLIALAGCTNDEFVGDQLLGEANGNWPISFSSSLNTVTRADQSGSDAAASLNKQFIVYAEKNETSGSAPAAGNLVFQNYQVNYQENSAYTTVSNTINWDYVGYTHTAEYQSSITTSTTDKQTIKYWDYGATNYVFTAVSALPADITAGRVKITKTTSGIKVYDKGYTITLQQDASGNYPSLSHLYISDRNKIVQSSSTNRDASNTYGGNATMKFRNSRSQVRVAMYETIPGYSISAISFKVTGDNAALNASDAAAFGAICPNVKADTYVGTITVTYSTGSDGGTENQPKLAFESSAALSNADLILGTNINAISQPSPLAETAASPTFDTSGGAFTSVLPQVSNTSPLHLKVDYTLYNSITGETITVDDATAVVPAEFLQWKPNYKYTYLFKISDNTNGQTGTGSTPSGLYPISFDALEVSTDDGQAEYITTVTEPSITTFGVKDGLYQHDGSDYLAGSDIYVTVTEGSMVITPTSSNYKVYTVSTTNATTYPITEASVAESIADTSTGTKNITTADYSTNVSIVSKVPSEDGNSTGITIAAVKLGSVEAGTYAFEYTKSTAAVYTQATGTYVSGTTYYTDNTGATTVNTSSFTAGTTDVSSYYILSTPATTTKYYKVIKVASE